MFKSGYKAVASAMDITTPIVSRETTDSSDKLIRRKKSKKVKKYMQADPPNSGREEEFDEITGIPASIASKIGIPKPS